MKSYIKSIIIFNENGEKRIVPLKQGVNIITGESKTERVHWLKLLIIVYVVHAVLFLKVKLRSLHTCMRLLCILTEVHIS